MGFADAVRTCLRKYATFSGRATRPEYWYFVLFLILAQLALSFVDFALFGGQVSTTDTGFSVDSNAPLTTLFGLAMVLPSLTAGWRRMHDTGRSGLFLLYPLIVIVGIGMFVSFMDGFGNLLSGNFGPLLSGAGAIITAGAMFVFFISPLLVLWWLSRPSQPGANAFGPAPAG